MLRKLAIWIALCSSVLAQPVFALGLGDISVQSNLSQPFVARVPVLGVPAGAAENLQASLASADEYRRVGLDRVDYLLSLQFSVVADGTQSAIIIRGELPAREPLMSLLIRVREGGASVLREYTIFLDPPGMAAAAASQAVPQTSAPSAPAGTPKPAAVAKASAPASLAPAPAGPRGSSYGPVREGETFWSIAEKLRPSSQQVSMDQMLLALYRENPSAFSGDINSLMKGSLLTVPPLSRIQQVAPGEATRQLSQLRAGPARPVAPAPTVVAAPQPAPLDLFTAPAEPLAETASEPELLALFDATEEPVEEPVEEPMDSLVDQSAAAAGDMTSMSPSLILGDSQPSLLEEQPPDSATDSSDEVGPAGVAAVELLAEPLPATGTQEAPETAADQETDRREPPIIITPGSEPSMLRSPAVIIAAILALAALIAALVMRRKGQLAAAHEEAARHVESSPQPTDGLSPVLASTKKSPRAPSPGELEMLDEVLREDPDAQPADEDALALEATDFDATQTLTPPSMVMGSEDFDATAQREADTVDLDLGGDDPIAEADYRLQYGLYDEAALLLEDAAEQDPERTDVRVKLAETYFAAARPVEFLEAAQSLAGQVDSETWQKIAIMGRQISPESPLFEDLGDISVTRLDMNFDEPEFPKSEPEPEPGLQEEVKVVDFDLDLDEFDISPAPGALDVSADSLRAAPGVDSSEHPQEPALEESVLLSGMERDDANAASSHILEFDLTDFDLSDQPPAAPMSAPEAPAETPVIADAESLVIDLGADGEEPKEPEAFDFGDLEGHSFSVSDDAPTATAGPAEAEVEVEVRAEAAGTLQELSLDFPPSDEPVLEPFPETAQELEVALEPREANDAEAPEVLEFASELGEPRLLAEESPLSFDTGDDDPLDEGTLAADEVGTKLDLARAYTEMGDHEMARSLLEDVFREGSEDQLRDAEGLLARLPV